MSRFGITREEADDLTGLIMNSLASAPLARQAITAAVRPKVSKRVRAWMEKVWSGNLDARAARQSSGCDRGRIQKTPAAGAWQH